MSKLYYDVMNFTNNQMYETLKTTNSNVLHCAPTDSSKEQIIVQLNKISVVLGTFSSMSS